MNQTITYTLATVGVVAAGLLTVAAYVMTTPAAHAQNTFGIEDIKTIQEDELRYDVLHSGSGFYGHVYTMTLNNGDTRYARVPDNYSWGELVAAFEDSGFSGPVWRLHQVGLGADEPRNLYDVDEVSSVSVERQYVENSVGARQYIDVYTVTVSTPARTRVHEISVFEGETWSDHNGRFRATGFYGVIKDLRDMAN